MARRLKAKDGELLEDREDKWKRVGRESRTRLRLFYAVTYRLQLGAKTIEKNQKGTQSAKRDGGIFKAKRQVYTAELKKVEELRT